MAKLKKPDYYKCPLRSRKDIVEFIIDETDQRCYDHRQYPLCFNVKLYNLNLEFAHLLQLWMDTEPGSNFSKEAVCRAYRFYQENADNLSEWAIDDARTHFVSDQRRSDGAPEGDCFQTTWDGKQFDVRYAFVGRSGGWLSIVRFQYVDFATWGNEIEEQLTDMDFKDLRMLYQLVVMLKHDLQHPEKEVEHQAAFALFNRLDDDE